MVKANGRANLCVTTFLRDARGLLVDRSQDVARAGKSDVDLLPALKVAIARAAAEGQSYTKTGGNGVNERRHERPEVCHAIGKHRLADWVSTLLEREELVMAMAQGSQVAGRAGRSSRQRAGGVRHRAPTPVQSGAAGWRLSVPGFPAPGREREVGWERQTQHWHGKSAFPA